MATQYAHGKIVTDGLVLCLDAADPNSYPGSGTTWNDVAGTNNGTLTNGPTYSNGAIVFDGVDDYVTLGNNKFRYTTTDFTLESVFYFPNIPNNPGAQCSARHPIVYNHDFGYNLLMRDTGKIGFYIYNTVSTSKQVLSTQSFAGIRCHAVGFKQGTTVGLYINGVLQGTDTLTTNNIYYSNHPFTIGGFAQCGNNRFYATGNINMVRLYNRTLTSSEVLQNFNAQKSRFGL